MSWAGQLAETSINAINTEVGFSATSTREFNNSRIRNLARRTTNEGAGDGTIISMENMRFGLLLPMEVYTTGSTVELLETTADTTATVESYIDLTLFSNGSGSYVGFNSTRGTSITYKSFNWLRSGDSNTNYTGELVVNLGDAPTSGATGTELALTSNRTWRLRAVQTNNGVTDLSGLWTINIRRGGVLGPVRQFNCSSYAEKF